MSERHTILLVEDNPGDVRLVQEAFGAFGTDFRIRVARDGEEAADVLFRADADAVRPDLVLLDVNLPKKDGTELLAEIKDHPELRRTPVLVLSSSTSDEDVATAYDRGANAYLTKPVDPVAFMSLAGTIEEFWFSLVELPPTQ